MKTHKCACGPVWLGLDCAGMPKPKSRVLIEPILRTNILRMADACVAVRKVQLTTLSGEVHGDPQWLPKLKAGKGALPAGKYDKAMLWFDQWFAKNPQVSRPAIKEPFPNRGKVTA